MKQSANITRQVSESTDKSVEINTKTRYVKTFLSVPINHVLKDTQNIAKNIQKRTF